MENQNVNALEALALGVGDEVLSLSIYPTYGTNAVDRNSHEIEMSAELRVRRADGSMYVTKPDNVIYYTNDTGISVSGNKVIVSALPAQTTDRFLFVSAIVPNGGYGAQCRLYQYNIIQYAKIGTHVQPSLSGMVYEAGVYECCVCDKNGNKFGLADTVCEITVVSGQIEILDRGRIKIDKDTNAEIRIVAVYPGRPVAFLQVAGK